MISTLLHLLRLLPFLWGGHRQLALEVDMTLRGVKALAHAKAHMKPVREVFGSWRAVELTAEAIDRQIERWLAEEVARATVNRRMQLLGQAFRLGHQRHRVMNVPTFSACRRLFTPRQIRDFARLRTGPGHRRSRGGGEIIASEQAIRKAVAGDLCQPVDAVGGWRPSTATAAAARG